MLREDTDICRTQPVRTLSGLGFRSASFNRESWSATSEMASSLALANRRTVVSGPRRQGTRSMNFARRAARSTGTPLR